MSDSDIRFVPMTRMMRDFLAEYETFNGVMGAFIAYTLEKWDAAPADTVEAVTEAVQGTDIIVTVNGPTLVALTRDEVVRRVLVALGYPGGSPRQETPT